jgi:hypothetical protein
MWAAAAAAEGAARGLRIARRARFPGLQAEEPNTAALPPSPPSPLFNHTHRYINIPYRWLNSRCSEGGSASTWISSA